MVTDAVSPFREGTGDTVSFVLTSVFMEMIDKRQCLFVSFLCYDGDKKLKQLSHHIRIYSIYIYFFLLYHMYRNQQSLEQLATVSHVGSH